MLMNTFSNILIVHAMFQIILTLWAIPKYPSNINSRHVKEKSHFRGTFRGVRVWFVTR